jgi:CheY-like chemotaxis protein
MSYLNTVRKEIASDKELPSMNGYLVFKNKKELHLTGTVEDTKKALQLFKAGKNPVVRLTTDDGVTDDEANVAVEGEALETPKAVNMFLKQMNDYIEKASLEVSATNQSVTTKKFLDAAKKLKKAMEAQKIAEDALDKVTTNTVKKVLKSTKK